MKKAFVVLSLSACILFFAGCGDSNGGSGGSSVSGGFVNEHEEFENNLVNSQNFDEFLYELEKALYNYYWINSSESAQTRSAKNRINKKREYRESGIDTILGYKSGYRIDDWSDIETETSYSWTYKLEVKMKFFDYSENGSLFLGGALNESYYDYGNERTDEYYFEDRLNGTINFRGKFSGSIVANNFYVKVADDWYNYKETFSGSLIVKSGNNQIDFKEYYQTIWW